MRNAGVKIFAIGVGVAKRDELEEIASEPYDEHVIFLEGQDYSKVSVAKISFSGYGTFLTLIFLTLFF